MTSAARVAPKIDRREKRGPLFEPFKSGQLSLPNRIVMAPMTRRFSPGNTPTQEVAAYYRRRAEGGVGLITTEGTYVAHASAGNDTRTPRLDDATFESWKTVVDGVHLAGGKISAQLWHIGIWPSSAPSIDPSIPLIGPSGLTCTGARFGREATEADIEEMIAAYGRSAELAKRAGFDAIEIHAAHGYMIDQFFWSRTNVRTDRWGGDMAARARLAREIVRACRAAMGPDFPIIFRYSQWKIDDYKAKLADTPTELGTFLGYLVDAGVDIFHASTRRFWDAAFDGGDLTLAGWTRKLSGKPTIAVGSVGLNTDVTDKTTVTEHVNNYERVEELYQRGEFDLIAVGRALLADPQWVSKMQHGDRRQIELYVAEHKNRLH